MWELTIVALVAMVALGMLVGHATRGPGGAAADPVPARPVPSGRGRLRGRVVRMGAVGVALAAILCIAVPMLGQQRLEQSQAAAARGDVAGAQDAAHDARSMQPWAATPHLQLALVAEQAGDLRRANSHVRDALEHDDSDWSIWLVAARIQTKAGLIREGRRSLRRAQTLNPKSEIFKDLREESRERRSR